MKPEPTKAAAFLEVEIILENLLGKRASETWWYKRHPEFWYKHHPKLNALPMEPNALPMEIWHEDYMKVYNYVSKL